MYLYLIAAALSVNVVVLALMALLLVRFEWRRHRASMAWKKFHLLKLAGHKRSDYSSAAKITTLAPIMEERPGTNENGVREVPYTPHEASDRKLLPENAKAMNELADLIEIDPVSPLKARNNNPKGVVLDTEDCGGIMPNFGNRALNTGKNSDMRNTPKLAPQHPLFYAGNPLAGTNKINFDADNMID